MFLGGPVAPEAVIALARGDAEEESGWMPLIDDLGTVDLGRDPTRLGSSVRELRVYLGYAGWGPAQLQAELDHGAWFVVEALPSDPFATEPDALWQNVLRRQRGGIALFATCPPDPTVN